MWVWVVAAHINCTWGGQWMAASAALGGGTEESRKAGFLCRIFKYTSFLFRSLGLIKNVKCHSDTETVKNCKTRRRRRRRQLQIQEEMPAADSDSAAGCSNRCLSLSVSLSLSLHIGCGFCIIISGLSCTRPFCRPVIPQSPIIQWPLPLLPSAMDS